jgi:S1-C subfamily serine protease
MRRGKLLAPEAARKYWQVGSGVLAGGNMHGFETYYTTGPDTMFFLCSNDISQPALTRQLTEELIQLVNASRPRIGIVLRADSRGLIIDSVIPNSPAHHAGLQKDDRLTAINDAPLDPQAGPEALAPHVSAGQPLTLTVQRSHETLRIKLTPAPG